MTPPRSQGSDGGLPVLEPHVLVGSWRITEGSGNLTPDSMGWVPCVVAREERRVVVKKAEVLRGRLEPEGGEHGWNLTSLSHGVGCCGGSHPPHNHQVQVAKGERWHVWARRGGGEMRP